MSRAGLEPATAEQECGHEVVSSYSSFDLPKGIMLCSADSEQCLKRETVPTTHSVTVVGLISLYIFSCSVLSFSTPRSVTNMGAYRFPLAASKQSS